MRLEGGGYGPRERARRPLPVAAARPDATCRSSTAYDTVMANSEYTRGWIRRLWKTDADVLFPPIQVDRLHPAAEREKAVLSRRPVLQPGPRPRQAAAGDGARSSARCVAPARCRGWSMSVVGGCEESQRPYLERCRRPAAGLPVEVIANAPRAGGRAGLLSTASVFWSATGLRRGRGARRPGRSEHFGMTTVEAMAGGCVPVVIDRAGQKEIVREGVDGFRWSTPDELVGRTAAGRRRRAAAGRGCRRRRSSGRRSSPTRPSPTAGTRSSGRTSCSTAARSRPGYGAVAGSRPCSAACRAGVARCRSAIPANAGTATASSAAGTSATR